MEYVVNSCQNDQGNYHLFHSNMCIISCALLKEIDRLHNYVPSGCKAYVKES